MCKEHYNIVALAIGCHDYQQVDANGQMVINMQQKEDGKPTIPPHSSPSQPDQLWGRDILPSLPQFPLLGCLPVPQHIHVSPIGWDYEINGALDSITMLPLGFHSHPSTGPATVEMQGERPPINQQNVCTRAIFFVVPGPEQRQSRV